MQIFYVNIYNFRHFLHILTLFRQFFYKKVAFPSNFWRILSKCNISSQNKEIVTQSIHELQVLFTRLRFDHSTLCTTAYRAAYMATAYGLISGWQQKTFLLRHLSLHRIYPLLQLRHIRIRDPFTRRCTQFCTKIEQSVLNPQQLYIRLFVQTQ